MFNRLCLVAVLALSSVCAWAAKPIDVPMPLAQELPVELIESQQEMQITVPQTASQMGMQFGLVGALIGSAVQNSQAKKAEAAVVPLRDLLVDYRFNQRVRDVLQPKLSAAGISPHPTVTVLPTQWDAYDAQQTAQLPPYALVLRPSYAVDNQFLQLTVTLSAQVVDRKVKSNGKVKTEPRFERAYAFQFPLQGARGEDPARDWLALGRDGLTRLLEQGIAQTTDMLVQDFSAEGRASWETKPKHESAAVGGNVYPGRQVRQGDGWVWVRNGKGRMQSLQGFQPLTVGTMPSLPAAPDAGSALAAQAAQAAETGSATPAAAGVIAPMAVPATDASQASDAAPAMPDVPAQTSVEAAPLAPVGG